MQNDAKFDSDKSTLYNKPVIGTVVNITSQLKIRAKAGTDSEIKGYLLNQASVTVYGKDGEWYQISTITGIFGYCHEDYIRLSAETAPEAGEILNPIKGTLRSGMNNGDVVAMQKRLKELGYFTASCTGYFGSQTLSAVKAFQAANGLTKDGIAGEKTLAKNVFGFGNCKAGWAKGADRSRKIAGAAESNGGLCKAISWMPLCERAGTVRIHLTVPALQNMCFRMQWAIRCLAPLIRRVIIPSAEKLQRFPNLSWAIWYFLIPTRMTVIFATMLEFM